MQEYAPSKINLFLDVIRKREDGYHDLGTIFQTIDAGDTVSAELRDDGVVTLEYNEPQNYPKESDLVYKAALALKAYAVDQVAGSANDPQERARRERLGADLFLEKVMPLGAGLGGGSADAAATLRLLSRLWNLNFEAPVLEEIGAKLGADVPFLVRGGTAFAEGIGERLTFMDPLELAAGEVLLVATPLDAVPTKDAYAGVPKSGLDRWERYKQEFAAHFGPGGAPSQTAALSAPSQTAAISAPSQTAAISAQSQAVALSAQSLSEFITFNAFETSVFPKHPLVAEMKAKFLELGAKCALMSGSGASVFGIFASRADAEAAAQAMKSISRYQAITKFWHKN
ncbi:MAG: 4-(cytidine 5'-diphospho)-2-C-methyl-D-erythritol kinase [Fibrobacter sp.]|nr:4-(cytidine 5'-diphospho)-2-C-methyl-D-erythritol kinase [Fibrobacter sp.]